MFEFAKLLVSKLSTSASNTYTSITDSNIDRDYFRVPSYVITDY
jgi:hypothetical protein